MSQGLDIIVFSPNAIYEVEPFSPNLSATLGSATAVFTGSGRIVASTASDVAVFTGSGRIASVLAGAAFDTDEYTRLVQEALFASDAMPYEYAWRFLDGASIVEEMSAVGQFARQVVDTAIAADVLLVVRDFLLSESLTVDDLLDETRMPVMVLVDAMIATDVASSVHQAVLLLASALALNESTTAALAQELADAIEADDSLSVRIAMNAALLSSALLGSDLNLLLQHTATLIDSPMLDDAFRATLMGSVEVADVADMDAVLLLEGIPYAAWVVNAETGAPSEYRNWNFESMTRLGGRYYGASESGLFLLDGDDDAGSPIEASLRTGDLDFGSPQIKRPIEAHIGYTASGDMVLKVTVVHAGNRTEYWYRCNAPVTGTATEARLPLGKGLASRHWQFELVNTAGGAFEFESIDLQMLDLSRRL